MTAVVETPLPADVGRRVATSTVSQAGGRVLHLILNVVSSLALIRYLTPSEYGQYVLVLTIVTIAGLFSDMGFNKIAIRDIVHDDESEGAIVGTIVALRLGLAVAAAAVVQAVLLALGSSPTLRLAGAVASAALLAHALLTVTVAFHVRITQQYEVAVRVVAEAIETALVLWLVLHEGSLVQLFAAPVVGLGVGVVLALRLVRRQTGPLRLRVDRSRIPGLVRTVLTVGPTMVIGVAYLRVDAFLVGVLRPSAELGIYGAAFQPVEYLLLASAVLTNVLYPLLTRWHGIDLDQFQRIYRRGTETLLAVLVLVPLTLAVAGGALVRTIYGADYRPAVLPMTVLAVALPFLALAVWHSFVLLAAGQDRRALVINIQALLGSLAADLVLIPRWGYRGAAIATLVVAVVVAALSMRAVAQVGATMSWPRMARLGAAATGLGITLVVLAAAGPWWLAVLGLCTYPQWLRWTGVVDAPAAVLRFLRKDVDASSTPDVGEAA